MVACVTEATARPRSRMFLSSLAGRRCLFASFPSTTYWATFTESLRDDSKYNVVFEEPPETQVRVGYAGSRIHQELWVRLVPRCHSRAIQSLRTVSLGSRVV